MVIYVVAKAETRARGFGRKGQVSMGERPDGKRTLYECQMESKETDSVVVLQIGQLKLQARKVSKSRYDDG